MARLKQIGKFDCFCGGIRRFVLYLILCNHIEFELKERCPLTVISIAYSSLGKTVGKPWFSVRKDYISGIFSIIVFRIVFLC